MRSGIIVCGVALALWSSAAWAAEGGITIPGGTIIDGNGGPPVTGTLMIQGNRIVAAPTSSAQAFCINANAEFYLHSGDPCRAGFRLGTHTCRAPDGMPRMLSRGECQNIRGTLELPAPQ